MKCQQKYFEKVLLIAINRTLTTKKRKKKKKRKRRKEKKEKNWQTQAVDTSNKLCTQILANSPENVQDTNTKMN